MAEVAAAYTAETALEGAAAAAYGVAKPTLPISGRWTQLAADLPLPRSSHSLCVIGGKAYIFGGEIKPRVPVDNEVHIYTLPSGNIASTDYTTVRSGAAPPPRVGHTAVAVGHCMYVFGGRGGKDMKPLEESGRVWVFDTRTNTWDKLDPDSSGGGPVPEARSYHAAAATEDPAGSGTLFIHAGCPASGRTSDVWAFAIAARTWTRLPDAPGAPRGGPALACTRERLFRFGGFDGTAQLGGQIDFLDLKSEKQASEWQSIKMDSSSTAFPGPRSVAGMHHITTGQGRNYLVLVLGEKNPSDKGHDGAGEFWDDVWAFQLRPEGLTAASIKDKVRGAVGAKTREEVWGEVRIEEEEAGERGSGSGSDGGKVEGPGARGWFASSVVEDVGDGAGVLVWGGVDGRNERLGDGWVLTLGN